MKIFVMQLINGLSIGSIYVLVAFGYTFGNFWLIVVFVDTFLQNNYNCTKYSGRSEEEVSKKIFPIDNNIEEKPENIDVNFHEETSDVYCSEELSRAAVGRLFDDDNGDDSPPPIESAFITGFDRAPAREMPARDKSPTKRYPVANEIDERFKSNIQEELRQWEEEPHEVSHDEAPIERYRRRETATTRLLNSTSDENHEQDRREQRRRRNPVPKPAVRVNVPTERQHSKQPRHVEEQYPTEDALNTFRRRYTSEDLFSPPRSTNKSVRQGQRGDVRKNRAKESERELETLSPLRMILAAVVIGILVLLTFLTTQLISFRNHYNEAQEELVSVRADVTAAEAQVTIQARDAAYALANAERQRDEFEQMLIDLGHDPNQTPTPPPNGDLRPAANDTTTPPPLATPELPTTHTVLPSENLSRLARRYFGNDNPSTIEHIRATNNLANPNDIRPNQVLQITPLP